MEIINASPAADLSITAIEDGLLKLLPKDLSKVILICSSSYSFHYIYNLIKSCDKDKDINKINFSLSSIDSSELLERDSWMLIDYNQQKMYYSEGA